MARSKNTLSVRRLSTVSTVTLSDMSHHQIRDDSSDVPQRKITKDASANKVTSRHLSTPIQDRDCSLVKQQKDILKNMSVKAFREQLESSIEGRKRKKTVGIPRTLVERTSRAPIVQQGPVKSTALKEARKTKEKEERRRSINEDVNDTVKWNELATKRYLDLKHEKEMKRRDRRKKLHEDKASASIDVNDPEIQRLQSISKYASPSGRGRKGKHRAADPKIIPATVTPLVMSSPTAVIRSPDEVGVYRLLVTIVCTGHVETVVMLRGMDYNVAFLVDSIAIASLGKRRRGNEGPLAWQNPSDDGDYVVPETRSRRKKKKHKTKVIKACSSDSSCIVIRVHRKDLKTLMDAKSSKSKSVTIADVGSIETTNPSHTVADSSTPTALVLVSPSMTFESVSDVVLAHKEEGSRVRRDIPPECRPILASTA